MVAECRFDFSLPALLEFLSRTWRADATGGPGNQYSVVDQLSFGFSTVLTIEPFDAARSVNQLLFAGEEWMAIGTYLKSDLRLWFRQACQVSPHAQCTVAFTYFG